MCSPPSTSTWSGWKDFTGQPPKEWTDTAVVQGPGTAKWRKLNWYLPCDNSGQPGCFTFTGNGFTVTSTPVASQLGLTTDLPPNLFATTPGQTVTFSASASPSTFGRFSVPIVVLQWRWVPDSGAAAVVCTNNALTCVRPITAPGTMYVDAAVSGAVQTKSIHLQVVPCPTADSLLNTNGMKSALSAAWNGSNPTADPATQRVERAARLDCPPGALCGWVVEPIGSGDNFCHSTIESNSGTKATINAHPFKEGGGPEDAMDPLPLPLPENCLQPGTPQPRPGTGLNPGPSPGDWDNLDLSIPNYIVNADYIYRIGGRAADGSPLESAFFPRSTRAGASCDPLQP